MCHRRATYIGQRTICGSWLFPSTVWVPGIKLRGKEDSAKAASVVWL